MIKQAGAQERISVRDLKKRGLSAKITETRELQEREFPSSHNRSMLNAPFGQNFGQAAEQAAGGFDFAVKRNTGELTLEGARAIESRVFRPGKQLKND